MEHRQHFHLRLKYLSEQVAELEKLGMMDSSFNKELNEEYKDKTQSVRIVVVIISVAIAFFPALITATAFSVIIERLIFEHIFYNSQFMVNLTGYSMLFIFFLILMALAVVIGLLIGKQIQKSAKEKKIKDFNNAIATQESNRNKAMRIYKEIREDMTQSGIPVEYRNSKALKKLSDAFALYPIDTIEEAIRLCESGKI